MNKVIIPFNIDHLKEFDVKRLEKVSDYKERLMHVAASGMAFSGAVDGKVLFSGGVGILWPGVGEAWVILTDDAAKHPLFLTKACLTVLNKAVKTYNLHRLQASVRVGFEKAEGWIKRLGFICEGRMKRYSANRDDHWMFGRIE